MQVLRKIGRSLERVQALFYRYFGRNYQCGCGHTAKWKTVLTIHGLTGVFRAPSKPPDYCPECFAKAAIKCAWCGGTILPGDPITLYSPGPPTELFFSTKEPGVAQQQRKQEDFVVPEHAVVYQREPRLVLVGCLGWDCADTGADRAGFWVMPGKVKRVATVYEMLMATGGEGSIIIGDLSDSCQAIPIPEENQ